MLLVGVTVVVGVAPIALTVALARRRGPMVSLAPVMAIKTDRAPCEPQRTHNQNADGDTMKKFHMRSPKVRQLRHAVGASKVRRNQRLLPYTPARGRSVQ